MGGFGGLFRPDFSGLKEPVLVASTDGVGTKLKVAIPADRHDTCRRRSRQSLRQRHPRPGRAAAFLSRLRGHGPPRSGRRWERSSKGWRAAAAEGNRASRGRDGRDAGLLLRGRVRRRGDDRRRRRSREDYRRLAHLRRRHRARPSVRRAAHERLFARETGLFRGSRQETLRCSREGFPNTVADALLAPHLSYLRALEPLLDADLVRGMAHITGGGSTTTFRACSPRGSTSSIRAGAWPGCRGVRDHPAETAASPSRRCIGSSTWAWHGRVGVSGGRFRRREDLTAAGQRFYAIGNVTAAAAGE